MIWEYFVLYQLRVNHHRFWSYAPKRYKNVIIIIIIITPNVTIYSRTDILFSILAIFQYGT